MDRRMGGSNENLQGVIRPSNIQGIGNIRRALSTISTNIIKSPLHPSDVHKKGDFTEKKAGSNNNYVPCATRKFATHLAVKEEEPLQPQEVDEEGYGMIDDHTVPMYVQHTEAMMDEIDRMDAEEIDEEELVLDIDSYDKNNPLAVTEYIYDLYAYYKKIESSSQVPSNYMARQIDINGRMRGILVDWLIEVHCRFELMDETLYLTVNLIDRFLALQAIGRDKLQLVGVTALLLACKYEEVAVPAVEDLVLISNKAFCRDELLNMEKLMINTLQFNLSVATPYVFIMRFLKAAQSDKRLEMLSLFIIELCLVEYEMLRFQPSLLAAAAVFTAQCALSGHRQWSKTCECHTSYNKGQLQECAVLMVALHENSGTGRLTGVYKKYCTEKYGYAAWTDPAVFLADEATF